MSTSALSSPAFSSSSSSSSYSICKDGFSAGCGAGRERRTASCSGCATGEPVGDVEGPCAHVSVMDNARCRRQRRRRTFATGRASSISSSSSLAGVARRGTCDTSTSTKQRRRHRHRRTVRRPLGWFLVLAIFWLPAHQRTHCAARDDILCVWGWCAVCGLRCWRRGKRVSSGDGL